MTAENKLEGKLPETCMFCFKTIEIKEPKEKEEYYVPALKAYLCDKCHKDYERYKAANKK